jgi:predicted nucleic acid-binding protein
VNEATNLSADLGLRGAGAMYVALARQLGIQLVSFDNEQLTLPRGLIQTISP